MKKIITLLMAALIAAFAFTSCGDGNGNDDGGGASYKVSGTIQNVPTGDDLILRAMITDSNDNDIELATSKVDANGNFSLSLPAVNDKHLSPLSDNDYDEFITVTGASTKTVDVGFDLYNGETYLGYIWYGKEEQTGAQHTEIEVAYMYSNGNATLKGSETGTGTWGDNEENEYSYEYTMDVTLSKGWNIVVDTSTENANGDETEVMNNKVPSGLSWMLNEFDQ